MVKSILATNVRIESANCNREPRSHQEKYRRSQSLDRLNEQSESDTKPERKTHKQLMNLIAEKDDQIEKLIQRVTTLHTHNNEFASEHEKQQHELQLLRAKIERFAEVEEKPCESCSRLTTQKNGIQTELTELKEQNKLIRSEIALQTNDNHMMKVLVYRLNAQLECHQQTMRKSKTDLSAAESNNRNEHTAATHDNIVSIDWGCVRTNVLAPLLNAYQETIKEKNSLIHQYDVELNRMTGRLKDIASENEQMYVDIEQLRRKSDGWLTERARLQAQLDAYRNKVELHTKRADLAKEKLVEVMRIYEQKIQTQAIDIQRLQESCNRLKSEQNDCKTMHQQPELVIETLKKYQKLFEGCKAQNIEDKKKFDEKLGELEANYNKADTEKQQLLQRFSDLESDTEMHNKKAKKYEAKLERLRQQIQHIRQSRSILKERLKGALSWNRKMDTVSKTTHSVSWHDLYKVERLLYQKDVQIQQLRIQHTAELDKLQRKLHRRDELLRKMLLNKIRPSKRK